jgi:hypothetical protein
MLGASGDSVPIEMGKELAHRWAQRKCKPLRGNARPFSRKAPSLASSKKYRAKIRNGAGQASLFLLREMLRTRVNLGLPAITSGRATLFAASAARGKTTAPLARTCKIPEPGM